jgi:hypothetical protein
MWRWGGDSAVDGGGHFNVSITGVEGRGEKSATGYKEMMG